MKKIVFLAFLYFTATDAFAIVGGDGIGTGTGCGGYTTMSSCNSSTDSLSCYYGYTREYTNGPMSFSCYECTNLPLTDHVLVYSATEAQPTISLLTSKTEYIRSGIYYEYGNIDGFCPALVTCPAGYGLKLYKNSKCNALSTTTDCRYYISCEKCSMGTFDKETQLVRLYEAGDGSDDGLFFVTGERYDADINHILVLDDGMLDSTMYGCGACGTNATVNSAGNNCDCDIGYGYYDSNGKLYTTNVGEKNCVKRRYKVYLNTGSTASSSSPYITYQYGAGYDLDNDGTYADDGTSLDSVVTVTEAKKNFNGWSLWPYIDGVGTACNTKIWPTNAVNHSTDIATACYDQSGQTVCGCTISEYDEINLYKWWSWKNYTVKYNDGSNKTKTCTYNSDCKLDYAPTTSVTGGKLFQNWQYTLSGRTYTIAQDGNIKEIEQTGEFPDNIVSLTPVYTDCPAGYYCKNNVQTECQPGTYCPAGASAEIPCPAGYYCPDTKNAPTECGVGNYCPARSTAPTVCLAGYYCPTTTTVTPTECGMGNYCPEGSVSPNTCQAGWYCPTTTTVNPTKCDSGHYCPDDGMSAPTPCDSGYYCPEGSKSQNKCPAGYYCTEKSEDAEPCPLAGTTSGGNAKSAADCYVSEDTNFKDTNNSGFKLPITDGAVKVK